MPGVYDKNQCNFFLIQRKKIVISHTNHRFKYHFDFKYRLDKNAKPDSFQNKKKINKNESLFDIFFFRFMKDSLNCQRMDSMDMIDDILSSEFAHACFW